MASQLNLGGREQELHHHPPRLGAGVDPVLRGKELAARRADALDRLQPFKQRAPEAIHPRHHHAIRHAALNPPDGLQQQRAISARAGLIELLDHPEQPHPPNTRPRLDVLPLHIRRDKPLPTARPHARHAHIPVHRSGGLHVAASGREQQVRRFRDSRRAEARDNRKRSVGVDRDLPPGGRSVN